MNFHFSIYFLPLLVAVVLCAVIIFYVWRFRSRPEGKALLALGIAVAWWTSGNILEYGFQSLAVKQFWASMEYLGIGAVPIAWVTVVAIYTDQQKWITLRNLILLSILPAITVIMIFTNNYHGLMRYNITLDTNGPFSVISKTYGIWFWIQVMYNHGLMITGIIMVLRRLFRPPRLQHRQLLLLLAIAFIPWIGNIVFIFKLGSWSRIDISSTLLSISGIMMTFGLVRFHLLDVIPIGRDFVLEDMTDAILIVDSLNRVVDYNGACRQMFHLGKNLVTQPMENILTPIQDLLAGVPGTDASRHEFSLKDDSDEKTYELRVNSLYNQRKKFRGRIFHFQDISERKAAEREREKIIAELQEALEKVDTLSGFLPICANCKKIRDDQGYWNEVESYISQHSKAQFSHSLCADCIRKLYPEEYERLKKRRKLD